MLFKFNYFIFKQPLVVTNTATSTERNSSRATFHLQKMQGIRKKEVK